MANKLQEEVLASEDRMPITAHLPEDHEGRQIYGLVKDPFPEKDRALRHKISVEEA